MAGARLEPASAVIDTYSLKSSTEGYFISSLLINAHLLHLPETRGLYGVQVTFPT